MNLLRHVLWAAAAASTLESAHAVRLAQTGQALIYPYYSAMKRSDGAHHETYLSVVNLSSDAKVLRVRIAEGRNHRAALALHVYLPDRGAWTAAIVPGAEGEFPKLVTADRSCTNPAIPPAGLALRATDFIGSRADGAGIDPDRLAEGFVEVIEMATIFGDQAHAATPGTDGRPADCAALQGAQVRFSAGLGSPTEGLTGTATVMNVRGGYEVAYRATALAELTRDPIYRDVEEADVSLDFAEPFSTFTVGDVTYRASWSPISQGGLTVRAGAVAVSSVLMARSLSGEVVLDKATASNTEWAVTAPTRRFFVNGSAAAAPFARRFAPPGVCELVAVLGGGRDELPQTLDSAFPLCWGTTVLRMRNGVGHTQLAGTSPVLGSRNEHPLFFGRENGMAELAVEAGSITSGPAEGLDSLGNRVTGPVTLQGLPLVGISASTFVNGQVPCGSLVCRSTFAPAFPLTRR